MPSFDIKNSQGSAKQNVAGNFFSPGLYKPFFTPKGVTNFIQRQPAQQVPAKPNLSSLSAKDPASSKSHPSLINAALATAAMENILLRS